MPEDLVLSSIILALAVLAAVDGADVATDEQFHKMLPLAVGNFDSGDTRSTSWGVTVMLFPKQSQIPYAFEAVIDGEKWDFWIDPTGEVLSPRDELPPCDFGSAARRFPWGALKQESHGMEGWRR